MALLRVVEAFTFFRTNPYGDDYPEGTIVDDSDPKHKAAVKVNRDKFETVEQNVARRNNPTMPVEQATAAPGEKRNVAVPRKRAAKAKG